MLETRVQEFVVPELELDLELFHRLGHILGPFVQVLGRVLLVIPQRAAASQRRRGGSNFSKLYTRDLRSMPV